MNIYQRLNEVRKAVEYIKKDMSVQGYMAVSHDAVTAMTRDHLIAQGVVIIPSLVSAQVVDTGTTTSKGTPFIRMEAVYRFTVLNADDPQDKFDAEIAGHAVDQGDKAPGKVLSYCKKAFILKLLELESGDDDEGRAEQHKPKPAKSVAADTWDSMTEKQKTLLTDAAMDVIGLLNDGEDGKAFEAYTLAKEGLDVDEQVAFWSRFSSDNRATIKRMGKAYEKAEAARKKGDAK